MQFTRRYKPITFGRRSEIRLTLREYFTVLKDFVVRPGSLWIVGNHLLDIHPRDHTATEKVDQGVEKTAYAFCKAFDGINKLDKWKLYVEAAFKGLD